MITDYFVIKGSDTSELMIRVNAMIKKSYQPCGTLQVVSQGGHIRLYQAMIKVEAPEKSTDDRMIEYKLKLVESVNNACVFNIESQCYEPDIIADKARCNVGCCGEDKLGQKVWIVEVKDDN